MSGKSSGVPFIPFHGDALPLQYFSGFSCLFYSNRNVTFPVNIPLVSILQLLIVLLFVTFSFDGGCFFLFQELLSLAKRKRVDSGEQEEPVSKPAASTDSETSDSDDEVITSTPLLTQRLPICTETTSSSSHSGLSAAPKGKRRSSPAKVLRRRALRRRRSTKLLAARMEAARGTAPLQRRVGVCNETTP